MRRTATRSLSFVLASLLSLTGSGLAAPALRSPQVPVLGTALQSRFENYGQNSDVHADQSDFQSWPATSFQICGFSAFPMFQVEFAGNAAHNSCGLYLSSSTTTRIPIFPAEAGDGWFAIYRFRSAPNRLVVSLFDDQATFLGNTTYPGRLPSDILSFYVETPSGTLFGEDARNPGGDAQMLAFRGNGVNTGAWWFAWEDQPLPSSDHGFDDIVLFVQILGDCGDPVERSTWAQVKARFR